MRCSFKKLDVSILPYTKYCKIHCSTLHSDLYGIYIESLDCKILAWSRLKNSHTCNVNMLDSQNGVVRVWNTESGSQHYNKLVKYADPNTVELIKVCTSRPMMARTYCTNIYVIYYGGHKVLFLLSTMSYKCTYTHECIMHAQQ